MTLEVRAVVVQITCAFERFGKEDTSFEECSQRQARYLSADHVAVSDEPAHWRSSVVMHCLPIDVTGDDLQEILKKVPWCRESVLIQWLHVHIYRGSLLTMR